MNIWERQPNFVDYGRDPHEFKSIEDLLDSDFFRQWWKHRGGKRIEVKPYRDPTGVDVYWDDPKFANQYDFIDIPTRIHLIV